MTYIEFKNSRDHFTVDEYANVKTIEELEKLKEEVENLCYISYSNDGKNMVDITKDDIIYRINKHIEELKGE